MITSLKFFERDSVSFPIWIWRVETDVNTFGFSEFLEGYCYSLDDAIETALDVRESLLHWHEHKRSGEKHGTSR